MADSSPEPPLTVTDAQLYGILEGVHEALIQPPLYRRTVLPCSAACNSILVLDLDLSRSL